MNAFRLTMLGAAFAAASAHATYVNDTWAADGNGYEQNVYHIYNALYGTSYTDSNQIAQVADDVWFTFALDPSVTLLANQAAYTQNFGWYQENSDGTQTFHYVFSAPNATPGSSFDLEPVVDGQFGFYDDTVSQGGMLLYSAPWSNVDLLDHMVAFYTPDPNVFLLAFEDIPHAHSMEDFDYNDLIIQVSGVGVVPEPSTMVLLGLGLAGLSVRTYRKQIRAKA